MDKTKKIKLISKTEKIKFLKEDFTYEVSMLCVAYRKSIDYKKDKDISSINMALETFCLHARNLIEFFYLKQKGNYARKFDFIKEEKDNIENVKNKEKILERLNTEISHLSFNRIYGNKSEKGWDMYTLLNELLKDVRIFIEKLPEIYKSEPIIFIYKNILSYFKSINEIR